MVKTSHLYFDIDSSVEQNATLLDKLEAFASEQKIEIFVLKTPKSDLKDTEIYAHKGCLVLMSPGYKISLVNVYATQDEFDEYVADFKDIANYLFTNFEYRTVLGRYAKWSESLIDKVSIDKLSDIPAYFDSIKAIDAQESKNSTILVSLFTGSINDIERVKSDVPDTVLDQIKQKIQSFDADQTRFIFQEEPKKVIKIQGLSGTGKTELLLHKLKGLYQKPEKYKIFVTCHNKILADDLRKRIPEFFNFMKVTDQIEWNERLWCTNAWGSGNFIHSGLYRYICFVYGIPFQSYSFMTSFDVVCQNVISTIKKLQNKNAFQPCLDYILVDECQDFKDSFIEMCSLVAKKQVYLAGDIFQSIFAEHDFSNYEADTFLAKCYRTDAKTLMFAHGLGLGLFEKTRLRWLSDNDWKACGYEYQEIENGKRIVLKRDQVRRFLDVNDDYPSIRLIPFQEGGLISKLIQSIKQILAENKSASINDFCIILLDSDRSIYSLANKIEASLYTELKWIVNKAYESKTKDKDKLLISNRNNVKGLEYPFVICISNKISSDYTYRNAIYTMLTRSFLQTILFLPKTGSGVTDEILQGYKEIMDKRTMTINVPTSEEKQQIETRFREAKLSKPIAEIIKDTIRELNLSSSNESCVLQAASSYQWEGKSTEEIKKSVRELANLI